MDLATSGPPTMNHPLQKHANPYHTPQSSTAPVSYPSPFRAHPPPAESSSSSPPPSSHSMHPARPHHPSLSSAAYYPADTTAASRPPGSAGPPASSSRPSSRGAAPHHPPAQPPPPDNRALPPRDFQDDRSFEDAYVAFILYCNPTIPVDVDTSDLRRNFSMPPRSDGKTFSTRVLFDLLKKFESKEIKTWTELALELGVEKPAVEKGQSSQKVQQYSVRLKRWLRASHIDAFFDYMMGKSHTYARDLPTSHDPFPEVRDGVCRDDDLALRALKPEFRPKRGRRRVDDIDDYEPMSAIEPKRPHLDTSVGSYPHSAYPGSAASAHPDDVDRYPGDHWLTPASLAPSSAVKTSSSGNYRFLVNETPTTPNPMSAVTPLSAHPDSAFDEPLSAISQSQRMRMRRRHGTAVSSAWPSNNTTPNGKLRGRPPTNRSVKDGPFVTFPANPKTKEGPVRDLTRSSLPLSARELTPPATAGSVKLDSPFRVPHMPAMPTPISATTNPSTTPSTTPTGASGRPKQLSLQVPQHVGNPVRLVTPTVIVNGSEDDRFKRPDSSHGRSSGQSSRRSPQLSHSAPAMMMPQGLPSLSNEALKRALVADLVRADITGRGKSLRGTEAKDLADALISSVRARAGSPKASGLVDDPSAALVEDMLRLTLGAWLGVSPAPGSSSSSIGGGSTSQPFSTVGVKKIHVRRFKVSGDGYESPIDDEDDDGDDASSGAAGNVKQTFDVEWELGLGSMSGKFAIKGLVLGDHGTAGSPGTISESRDVDMEGMESPSDWRRRWLETKAELERTREELKNMRDDVLKVALGQNR